MRKENPACYECLKSRTGIHQWRIKDGIARCDLCKIVLSKADSDDLQPRTSNVCAYHDGCPPDGPVCHLCEHLQPK
jgi:hypothetical protein